MQGPLEKFIKEFPPHILGVKQIHLEKIQKISAGYMNENYLIGVSGKSFLVRFSNFSDGYYGDKLDFEFQILKNLEKYQITPKAIFYGKMQQKNILIEEFLEGKQIFTFETSRNQKVVQTIKTLQDLDLKLDFVTTVEVLKNYKNKFISRVSTSHTPYVKEKFPQLLKDIEQNTPFYQSEKPVLCHNDLRLDNIIIDEKKAYLIDPEGIIYGNQYVDIAGYYSGNLFFEKFGPDYTFCKDDLINWCHEFFNEQEKVNKTLFLVYLQFFSDLTWLDQYVSEHRDDSTLAKLFEKNIKIFENQIQSLSKVFQNEDTLSYTRNILKTEGLRGLKPSVELTITQNSK